VSVSGSGSQTFSLPLLSQSGITYSFSGNNKSPLLYAGFSQPFVNQAEYGSAYVGVNARLTPICDRLQPQRGGGFFCAVPYRYVVTVAGQTYQAVTVCPYRYVANGTSCYFGRSSVAGTLVVTIAGQTYNAITICDAWGTGKYSYQCTANHYEISSSYTGTLTISGTANVFIRTVIGPISGIGDGAPSGTYLCPSGTFVYGFGTNTRQNIRNDGAHIVIKEIYCAESFGMTTDTIRAVSLYPGGGGVCNQNEYVKGFASFRAQADRLNYSIPSTLYCGRLITPSTQVSADAFNILNYNNGNSYVFSAGLGSVKAIAGLTGSIGYGPGGAGGPRFEPNNFYSRRMPTLINGSCSATHYNCVAGSSANNVNGLGAYTWSCVGSGAGTTASCSEAKPPTAILSANPSIIDSGESAKLTWSSTDATSCASTNAFFSTGNAASNSNGVSVTPSSSTTYSIICSGPVGTSSPATATVTVRIPTVSITAVPNRVTSGSSTTVSWNATNVNTCTITRNNVIWQTLTANISRIVSGSVPDVITSQTTYIIMCTNNASASASATTATQVVNVVSSFQEF
jgi:hypothetical protein